MRLAALLIVLAALTATACGEDEPAAPAPAAEATATPQEEPARSGSDAQRDRGAGGRKGTEIVLAGSPFGEMLYDSDRQAIYVFELDRRDDTNCHGECARAWPPVYTRGEPRAGRGVDADRLGTIERRDGRRQVTYEGRPLYYYAHEAPGEVKCHNVSLNGGLWWVVGADGRPLA